MYWPAVYIADAQGRIRHHQFGEGQYDECEWVVQRLLREAGAEGIGDDLVSVTPDGFEAQADWTNLRSPETYLGYEQGQNLASPDGVAFDEPGIYAAPDSLTLNQWALSGDWTIESRASVLNRADGRIAFRFHARDVHLVMSPRARGTSVPFRVLVDGEPPGDAHGLDVDEQGRGTLAQPRLHQLMASGPRSPTAHSRSPSSRPASRLTYSPSARQLLALGRPGEETRGLHGRDAQTRRAGFVPSPDRGP